VAGSGKRDNAGNFSNNSKTVNFPREILLHGDTWVEFLASSCIYFVLPIYSFKFVIIRKETTQSSSDRAQNYRFCRFHSEYRRPLCGHQDHASGYTTVPSESHYGMFSTNGS